MTPIQVHRHVTRHRDPVDGLSMLAVICAVGLVLAPLVAAIFWKLSSAEDPVSWRTGARVGALKPPRGVAANRGSSATFDPAHRDAPGLPGAPPAARLGGRAQS